MLSRRKLILGAPLLQGQFRSIRVNSGQFGSLTLFTGFVKLPPVDDWRAAYPGRFSLSGR